MRIMGLDYGSRTVGVALTDDLITIAQPFETITRESEKRLRRTFARLEEIIKTYDVEQIVVGLPLNMDDTKGERAIKSEEFAAALAKRTGLPVAMQDERLSTCEAAEVLSSMGVKKQEQKQYIDKIAAAYILEDYINAGKQDNSI